MILDFEDNKAYRYSTDTFLKYIDSGGVYQIIGVFYDGYFPMYNIKEIYSKEEITLREDSIDYLYTELNKLEIREIKIKKIKGIW